MRDFIYTPPETPLDILYQDDDLIFVNKPSGLLSVPGKANFHKDSLELRLKSEFPNTLLVHRLDMATSGVMVFARNPNAQRHIGLQFEKRYTKKIYLARVAGDVQGHTGHINLPLMTDWPNRPMQHVDFTRGKSAQTDWQSVERQTLRGGQLATRLYLYPVTGRSHQLRVHMLAIGHPILGDRLYAPDAIFQAADRLQLHALSLKLRHPADGRWIDIEAAAPF